MRAVAPGWLLRLTLRRKFLVTFGLILLLLGVSLGAILFYLSRINSYVERHTRITIPAVVTAANMRQNLLEVKLTLLTLTQPNVPQTWADIVQRLDERESAIRHALGVYRQTHAARTHPILFKMLTEHHRADLADQEDRTLQQIDTLLRDLSSKSERLKTMPGENYQKDAGAEFTEATDVTRQLIDATTTLIDVHTAIDAEMKSEGNSLLRQASLVILALVILLGLVIAATYAMVTTHLARPLSRLAQTADQITHHDLSASFDPWPTMDEVGHLAGSLTNMLTTLREQTHALERKTKELESFTYSVAHDLKAPLREIEGFSSLLIKRLSDASGESPLSDETTDHYIQTIRSSALRMTAFIDDLLHYSRLEQQVIPKSRVNVRALLDTILADVAPSRAPSPQIAIDVPFIDIWGEPTSIRQAVANLVDNAMKFSRDANPREITIGGRADETHRLLWVRDNGIGFDPKDADRIFGLFERLHSPTEYEGTGAGLAIVKLIMEKHEGQAWAESSPGQGSTFYLLFPEP